METIPLSEELLRYYKHRAETADRDLKTCLTYLDQIKLSHEAHHKATWELNQRAKEIETLQKSVSDGSKALLEERRQLLNLVEENDNLKIQELKDRRKIRYLLTQTKTPENETTYFKDTLDARFVVKTTTAGATGESNETERSTGRRAETTKRSLPAQDGFRVVLDDGSVGAGVGALNNRKRQKQVAIAERDGSTQLDDTAAVPRTRPSKRSGFGDHPRSSNPTVPHFAADTRDRGNQRGHLSDERSGRLDERKRSCRNAAIAGEDELEDEVSHLKLTVKALRAQLHEQKVLNQATIENMSQDREAMWEEMTVRMTRTAAQATDYSERVEQLQKFCRDNTQELLKTKQLMQENERRLLEEKAQLAESNADLMARLDSERGRNDKMENTVEARLTKKSDTVLAELRYQIGRYEEDARTTKREFDQTQIAYKKRIDFLQEKLENVGGSYKTLKRRRDFEIEGFTNDILLLRKQLRSLEKHILKFGPIEDREMQLLTIARDTGKKAEKISGDLNKLKGKVRDVEADVQRLAF